MARWATFCEIAGVSFTGCRVELVDATEFKTSYVGSIDWANDGTPNVQVVNRGVKGIPFGLQMQSTEGSKVTSVLTAVATAQGSGSTFRLQITDGIFTLDLDVVPDYSQEWLTLGKHSEGWYEGSTWRFIAKSIHS